MQTTAAFEDVHRNAEYFEYSKAADPIGLKIISRVPYHNFPASLYKDGPTRIVTLDLSKELGVDYPATGPGLLAHFVRVVGGEQQSLNPVATSQLLYVLAGQGRVTQAPHEIEYTQGAFVALPGGVPATDPGRERHGPLLCQRRAAPLLPRCRWRTAALRAHALPRPGSKCEAGRGRACAGCREAQSHLGAAGQQALSPDPHRDPHHVGDVRHRRAVSFQKPHRHQSIALDLIVDCKKGCYTLVGTELGGNSEIANPVRVDWEPGLAFVTPPGYWHAHYNESDGPAHVIPLQDAGLHSYLRTLDIRFT